MPLKSLIVIALRVYAIYWLVDGVSTLLSYGPLLWELAFKMSVSTPVIKEPTLYFLTVIPLGMVLTAAVLWFLAARLAAAVTRGHETNLEFSSLTREDLYRFAFVFLGLYFVLWSTTGVLQSACNFFALGLPLSDHDPQRGKYLWPMLGHVATFVAGFACMVGAGRWTRKLMRHE